MRKVTLIRGDGTGPELVEAARRCIEATGVKLDWEVVDAGVDVMQKTGTPLPEEVLQSVRRTKVALKGPITTPLGSGFRSVNVALRHELGLYACVRPCKYYPGVLSPLKHPETVDLVLVRENTEDLYAGVEFPAGDPETKNLIAACHSPKISPEAGLSIKPISAAATMAIVRYAFEYARKHHRRSVTAVTKSNIMKCTDGLFMQIAATIAKEYSDIPYQHVLVDNMCMQLVQKAQLYDVLVLPNLYGDILSDLCAGLVGGLGVAPGAAPKYKGQNRVNPTALILSGVLMLRHLKEEEAANRLEQAVAAVIRAGVRVTYDLKPGGAGAVGTKEMADAIIATLQN